jgi:hypothetical protein
VVCASKLITEKLITTGTTILNGGNNDYLWGFSGSAQLPARVREETNSSDLIRPYPQLDRVRLLNQEHEPHRVLKYLASEDRAPSGGQTSRARQ